MTRLFVDRLPSPIGTMTLVWDEAEVLRALDFEDHDARLRRLLQRSLWDRAAWGRARWSKRRSRRR